MTPEEHIEELEKNAVATERRLDAVTTVLRAILTALDESERDLALAAIEGEADRLARNAWAIAAVARLDPEEHAAQEDQRQADVIMALLSEVRQTPRRH